ncbi:hypothetical protein BDR07DRAFT_1432882 [Suillus spraguei]|nr:hypothetical protein BDR07DRAFT_1432882 [Suillus spraguei]
MVSIPMLMAKTLSRSRFGYLCLLLNFLAAPVRGCAGSSAVTSYCLRITAGRSVIPVGDTYGSTRGFVWAKYAVV